LVIGNDLHLSVFANSLNIKYNELRG